MSCDILLSLIDADPEQPRKHFDQAQLDELAQSMAANGLAVSILVRPAGERYTIVHGERRYRAALSLGWETIAADVRDVAPDEAPWLALIENVQRADLSPIEEAKAYRARLDAGITQQALGERIGKSQSYIATKLRYLKLDPEVQEALGTGGISEGHAKQLLRINEPVGQRVMLKVIANERLSVADTDKALDRILIGMDKLEKLSPIERSMLARVESEIQEGFHYLAATGKAMRHVQQILPPSQFEAWASEKLGMDIETAQDFAAIDNTGANWTERMIDHLKLRTNPIVQTALDMSRDIPAQP
jgi:ParB family chromosome partitioning protein